MDLKKEIKPLLWITAGFFVCYFLPVGWARFDASIVEALYLAKWYTQEHVVLCLLPAFFIAGAISGFLSQIPIIKQLTRPAKAACQSQG